jgi:hypothetical protein
MEKVVTGFAAGPDRKMALARSMAVAAAGCCVLGGAWAQDMAPQDRILTEVRSEAAAPVRLELNTSTVPRIEGQDFGFQGSRVDLSLLPASGSGLGVAVGMSGVTPRTGLQPLGAGGANMDVGVHLRQSINSKQVDVTAWRRMTSEQDALSLIQQRQPVYGARVELKLASTPKAGFNAERGFVGMQLESGAKISIKRKDGRPMVYYRTAF